VFHSNSQLLNPQECVALKTAGGESPSSVTTARNDRTGRRWLSGEPIFGAFNTIAPPNSPTCLMENNTGPGILPPNSYHSGGVNVGALDGSVRFISDTIGCGDLTLKCVKTGLSPYGAWGTFGSKDGGEATNP
jgi:prepilin-type processing-associated H-X9-DG protein